METFLKFYNERRNRDEFTSKLMEAEKRLHHVGEGENVNTPQTEGEGDHYTFGRYSFSIPLNAKDSDEPTELVAAYAIYVKRQTIAGDEVGAYERPTVDNA
jgi:hypothetical protein